MRPYRAISIDGKDFVYGWYAEIMSKHYIIPDTAIRRTYKWQDSDKIEFAFFIEVIPETVGQQVGQKDKNDREIYGSIYIDGKINRGGDIVKTAKYKGVVKYSREYLDYRVYTYPEHCYLRLSELCPVEVIGNIHQNSKLLGKNNEK